MRSFHASILLLLVATATGCTRPFTPATPNNFVELDDQKTYDYRASSPEGVVLGVRAIDNDAKGTLSFWAQAVELKLAQKSGYVLLDKKEVTCAGGQKGTQLRFAHDDGGDPHLYVVSLFVTPKRIYLLEAGGTKADVERYAESIDWSLRSFRPKG